jgi:sterol desaturase/sphingolipid hydroxylase (fatty acid hydroxylase superfamily)
MAKAAQTIALVQIVPKAGNDGMEFKFFALFGSLILFGFLELWYPFFHYKRPFAERVSTNLSLGVVNILATSVTTSILLKEYCGQPTWYHIFSFMPASVLTFPIAFLMIDAYMYGWHRLVHRFPLGWHLHSVHHSDETMNISTSYRFHTLEVVLSHLPKIFLLWATGVPLWFYMLYETFYSIELVFQHSNWNLSYKLDRLLSYVIVTPNYHRAHHSRFVDHWGINYCSFLTIWDTLFGTRYYPKHPKTIRLGMPKEGDAETRQPLEVG